MRRLFKVIFAATASVLVVCGALVAVLRLTLFRHICDRYETVLSHDDRRSVAYVFEACTTIGANNEAWVDIVSPTGHRIRIFSFVPWGGEISYHGVTAKGPFEPAATWLSPNELRISIGTVGRVLQRQPEADGVHVTYDIGLELYKP